VRDKRLKRTGHRRRAGIALLAALALLTLIALLIVGTVATTSLAQRSARLAQADAVLTSAADFALNSVMSDPATYRLADLPFGVPRTFFIAPPGSHGVSASVSATRLPSNVLWLVAQSTLAGLDQGQRRLNLVARFPSAGPLPSAAIMSRGGVSIGPDVTFLPDTSTEPGCNALPSVDVVLAPGASLTGGSARFATQQSANDSASYFLSARQLALLGGMPGVVHVRGDTAIAGGSFTGILIVDGALTITGPLTASGLLVAGGAVHATAGGFALTGALLSFAQPADGTPAIQLSGATIRYSACLLGHHFRFALAPRPVAGRSWAELF
jgi:hypothetical protein